MADVFSRDDMKGWFAQRYPNIKESTVRAHIRAGTVNDPNRVHYSMKVGDLVFKRSDGRFERYDSQRHGHWRSGRPLGSQPDDKDFDVDEIPRVETPAMQVDEKARRVLAELLGVELAPHVLQLTGGVTQRFDFVSHDQRLAGMVLDLRAVMAPEARWSAICEKVWLLEHIEGSPPRRVLLLSGDRRTSKVWVDNLGRVSGGVDLLFLDGERVIDLRGDE
jgi:hypothetical protein